MVEVLHPATSVADAASHGTRTSSRPAECLSPLRFISKTSLDITAMAASYRIGTRLPRGLLQKFWGDRVLWWDRRAAKPRVSGLAVEAILM